MKKIILLLNLIIISVLGYSQCPIPSTCTYTAISGTNYAVNVGETLCISSPTNYNSGSITLNGGTLYIANGATLSVNVLPIVPSTVNACGTLNGTLHKTTLNYYGSSNLNLDMRNGLIINDYSSSTVSLSTLDNTNTKTFNNYGTASLSVNQWNQPLTINNIGGTLTVTSTPTIVSGSIINNTGGGILNWLPSMVAQSGVIINNSVSSTINLTTSGTANSPTITNNGNFNVSGAYYLAGGSINNNSNMTFSNELRLDGGTLNINSNSTLTVNTLYKNSGTINMDNQSTLNIIQNVTTWNGSAINLVAGCASIIGSTTPSNVNINSTFLNNPNLNFCGAIPVQSGGCSTSMTSISNNGSGAYRMTGNFSCGSGLNNLNYVYITGITGVTNLNGYWMVNKINATTFDLIGSSYTSGAILTSSNILFDQSKLKLGSADYLGYSSCTNPCIPLPLILLDFIAYSDDNKNKLYWFINDASNTLYYELEKSIDATNFSKISTINPFDNNNLNGYTYYDYNPYVSTTFYRIKTIYKDGSYTYSIIVYSDSNNKDLVVYPNPTTDNFFVYYDNIINYNISITDMNGKNITSYTIEKNYSYIKILDLPKGIYMLNLYTDTNLLYKKIIKL